MDDPGPTPTLYDCINRYCINRYGRTQELLTGHVGQFYANFGGMKATGMSKFQQYLIDKKINHILGRVHHPQTKGKIDSRTRHFNHLC
jgi:hypothetical protein